MAVAILVCAVQLPAQEGPWKGLEFLIGTWEAKTTGGSAGASSSGAYTFRPELKGRVFARHSSAEGCKGPTDFDCDHGDILYIYPSQGGSFKAIYFDNEGHVIHCDVSSPAAQTAVFVSSAAEPGPQFRLSYELKGPTMYGKFQLRMPGQTEFRSYLEWSGMKRKP